MIEAPYFFVREVSRVIQEIKEYDSDTCSKIGIRIQDIRESRHMKAIELASYLGIGKNQMLQLVLRWKRGMKR